VTSRSDVLREVMLETGTTQSDLSRFSGVRQPSISGFHSGRVDGGDERLDRPVMDADFCTLLADVLPRQSCKG
jgi:predicted transcriptional regulator